MPSFQPSVVMKMPVAAKRVIGGRLAYQAPAPPPASAALTMRGGMVAVCVRE